ncbi:Protein of unknown function [Gryllus bimaculatus]|nr:Protein of unknown function [Gryllus bimaculatus]
MYIFSYSEASALGPFTPPISATDCYTLRILFRDLSSSELLFWKKESLPTPVTTPLPVPFLPAGIERGFAGEAWAAGRSSSTAPAWGSDFTAASSADLRCVANQNYSQVPPPPPPSSPPTLPGPASSAETPASDRRAKPPDAPFSFACDNRQQWSERSAWRRERCCWWRWPLAGPPPETSEDEPERELKEREQSNLNGLEMQSIVSTADVPQISTLFADLNLRTGKY